ncbi:hypothetical protein [Streptomyces laurentii]|uniref:hypothetical protein n=1 Tax=Streptomyces laurentii TaxID=39478 RepID=UPI0033F1FDC0
MTKSLSTAPSTTLSRHERHRFRTELNTMAVEPSRRRGPGVPLYVKTLPDPDPDPAAHEYPVDAAEIVINPSGRASYPDERPEDRTVEGILLRRSAHTHRQVAAMESLWCAGCGGRPDVDRRGMLWVLPAAGVRRAGFPAGPLLVDVPPLCLADAARALRASDDPPGDVLALRVTEAEVVGVRGTVYAPTGEALGAPEVVLFDDPRVHRVVADQLIREITRAEIDDTTLSAFAHRPADH